MISFSPAWIWFSSSSEALPSTFPTRSTGSVRIWPGNLGEAPILEQDPLSGDWSHQRTTRASFVDHGAAAAVTKAGIRPYYPRPRAGGDPRTSPAASTPTGFNPRPRAGGDAAVGSSVTIDNSFQPAPPRRGRHDVDA